MSPLVDIRNLHVSIPLTAGDLKVVRGISYTVEPGETFAIVGESGCGKSVSSLALMGLQPKQARVEADRMTFEGADILSMPRAALSRIRGVRLSMIFQDPMTALNPVYTIGDQLTEVYTAHGLGGRQAARERAIDLLERVGLHNAGARMTLYPHQLSGGLRQRVVIAMAMMCHPKLIIADEPTTALDVTVQALTLGILKRLQSEFGTAMILISHDLGVVANVADRVAVMYAGEIVETGTVAEVFAAPRHPYTQGLMSCIPGGAHLGGRLPTIPGTVPSLIGEIDGCVFRNRCHLARGACNHGRIAERLDGGHAYRCIHDPETLAWQGQPPAEVTR